MSTVPQSPYARALGARAADLHPVIRAYFSTLPEGYVGVGKGTFSRVGVRRAWLRPLLRPLQRQGVLYAGWATDVSFRVTNRLVASRLIAERTLALRDGDWTMHDAVALTRGGQVIDEIGEPARIAARFDVDVRDESLHLVSNAVGLRLGRLRLRVPRLLSPTVRLVESYGPTDHRQHVDLTLSFPLIGTVYEQVGWFDYRVQEEA